MSIGWVVAIAKPSRELYAAENLARQDVDHYFPRIVESVMRGPRTQRQRIERISPLFPRYIFCHVEHQWRHLLSTYGLMGIIMHGEGPAFVNQRDIDLLHLREDDAGLVHLPPPPKQAEPQQGSRVVIANGQMAGQSGIYDGMPSKQRQQVLLDYLGRKTKVLIRNGDLVAQLHAA